MMTTDQLLTVLDAYEALLEREDYGPAARTDTSMLCGRSRSEAACHVLWMIREVRTMLTTHEPITQKNIYEAQARAVKANRWLGFIQGVLWSFGFTTIDEMRDLNRDPREPRP